MTTVKSSFDRSEVPAMAFGLWRMLCGESVILVKISVIIVCAI